MPKILIVEDNEDNWQILSRRLRRRGYDVVIARDGKQGLTMALSTPKGERPDLILMDMNLPLLDGWEATRLIKADPKGKNTPVIALTAHALTGDRDKALEAGCDDYHTKPVELPRLLEQMEALLAKRAAAIAAKVVTSPSETAPGATSA
jgi:CheY-like chemotaxis protein